jgi:hypothetical protein
MTMKRLAILWGIALALTVLCVGIALADDFHGASGAGQAQGGGATSAMPPAAGRKQYNYFVPDTVAAVHSGTTALTQYGAGVKAAGPTSTRHGISYALPATAGNTDATITGAVTRAGFKPKISTVISLGSTTSITHFFALDNNSGTCNIGSGSTQFTAQTAGGSCTNHMAGLYHDTRGAQSTKWLCCSSDGTSWSCSDTGVTVATSTDYTLIADLSQPGTLTCTVNGTSVAKSNNLPAAATDLKLNWGAMNNVSSANTGPNWAGVSLDQTE